MSAPDDKRCAELAAQSDRSALFHESAASNHLPLSDRACAHAEVAKDLRDIAAALRAIPKLRALVGRMKADVAAYRTPDPALDPVAFNRHRVVAREIEIWAAELAAILGATEKPMADRGECPPRADGLAALAERVEREEPSYDLWVEAAVAARKYVGNDRWIARRQDRFHDLATLGAYRDAAAMLMPEGWEIATLWTNADQCTYGIRKRGPLARDSQKSSSVCGPHAEARARLAAALRALAAGGNHG